MNRFPFISQQLFNVPLMLQPEKAEMIIAALADRLGVTHLFRDGNLVFGPSKPMMFWDDGPSLSPEEQERLDRGYDIVDDIAYVPVRGTLVQRLGSARPYSGMTGYDSVRNATLRAMSDPRVRAVMLDVDSPGGSVAGGFDLVDTLYSARGIKPVWAMCNENACSGAYAIVSAADFIAVPRTGSTGSIGVITMHVDLSGALAKEGMAVTLITYGKQKADGASVKPLEHDAQARIQADVNKIGELFVATVARNRGLTQREVRNTEAGVFLGQAGVDAGLADAVMAPDEAHRALLASL